MQRHYLFLIPVLLVFCASQGAAQQENPSATVPVRTVATVLGKNFSTPPPVTRDDVQVYDGKTRMSVSEWVPAKGERGALDFAIVIDDASSTTLGLQLKDIADFIREMPPNARVGIFYARNGTVEIAQNFTADHEQAAKALRLPVGNPGAFGSDYLSLLDLFKRWPESSVRREVLLVSDGIDRFRGDIPTSPDLLEAIARAQRGGIMVHTIYANAVGRFGRNSFRVNLGQSNLSQLADDTGGEAFFQGYQTPIAYAPFLKELSTVLANQYLLTFLEKPAAKGDLRRIRVHTEVPGAEISVPEDLYVPSTSGK
jgi:hypothetical protein